MLPGVAVGDGKLPISENKNISIIVNYVTIYIYIYIYTCIYCELIYMYTTVQTILALRLVYVVSLSVPAVLGVQYVFCFLSISWLCVMCR